VIPLRDDVRNRHAPLMTVLLIAVNAAIFVWEARMPPAQLEQLVFACGMIPARYPLPAGDCDYLPFLTSMFLHGGWLHALSNLWVLWIFGDNVEDRMGATRFLGFYLLCGLLAGALHWVTNPESRVPTIGASGAIAGVMGAYFVLYPRAKVVMLVPIFFWPFFFEIPAVLFLGFWFVTQFFSGTLALGAGETAGGVAWWAHVGGFVAGILLLPFFYSARHSGAPRRPPPQRQSV
jgi:membrane associated rhomboid family serine protease